MAQEPRIYVIDPDEADPNLIRNMTALGEAVTLAQPRRLPAGRRAIRAANRVTFDGPPSHPARLLVGAYLAGPLSLLASRASRSRRACWIAALAPLLLGAAAAAVWTRATAILGPRELTILVHVASLTVAGAAWLAVWAAGLVSAGRRCKEGPLARRGQRRPFAAGILGFAAPGLGLLLAGHAGRAGLTVVLVGTGALAAAILSRASAFWSWHRQAPDPLLTSHQLEMALVALGGAVGVGLLIWLISALEGARLASGPRVVHRSVGTDRVSAALLAALIAFGFFFRPIDIARELDRVTGDLVAGGLRLIPRWTAGAAAAIAPTEPRFALRLAERHEDLGDDRAAATIRAELASRWQQYARYAGSRDRAAATAPTHALRLPFWQSAEPYDVPPLAARDAHRPVNEATGSAPPAAIE